ncbi:MAG: tetratricopeptide repeat protein [Deltaproteobacteria bacterium]|jgi:hypothetical protein|nr:tetratricopeptide repeat protein [Deltaproteobacteria bacterium]MBW2537728.1 tetratricopeptide repeat protein [Deltaproteobacteria bacterium]
MLRTLIVTLLLCATASIVSPAAAQPSAPADVDSSDADALKRKATELLREGNRLAGQGDFGAALPKFNAAYELYPSPKLLLNIGTSLRHTGRYAAAAEVYERYLSDPETDPALEREIRSALDELDDKVGWIKIRMGEPGLRLSLDGRVLENVGRQVKLRVDPGPHTVVAEKRGRDPAVRHVSVKALRTSDVLMVMSDAEGPPPEPIPVRPIIGYGIAALGGATLVAGGIVGAVALSTTADADEQCADNGDFKGFCTEEGVELAGTARSQGTAAAIILAAGAAAVAIGLAIAWSGEDEDEEGVARVVIAPGPGPTVLGEMRW